MSKKNIFSEMLSSVFIKDEEGFSTLQLALGGSALAVAAALFLTPALDYGAEQLSLARSNSIDPGVDPITTATTGKAAKSKNYVIRHSIMQKDPSVPCIIYEDGTKEGGC